MHTRMEEKLLYVCLKKKKKKAVKTRPPGSTGPCVSPLQRLLLQCVTGYSITCIFFIFQLQLTLSVVLYGSRRTARGLGGYKFTEWPLRASSAPRPPPWFL